jgi:hypothetical protein
MEWLKDKLNQLSQDILKCWKSWTIWFNGAITSIALGLPYLQDAFPQLQPYIPNNEYMKILGTITAINILLRFKTKSRIADK